MTTTTFDKSLLDIVVIFQRLYMEERYHERRRRKNPYRRQIHNSIFQLRHQHSKAERIGLHSEFDDCSIPDASVFHRTKSDGYWKRSILNQSVHTWAVMLGHRSDGMTCTNGKLKDSSLYKSWKRPGLRKRSLGPLRSSNDRHVTRRKNTTV